MNVVVVNIYHRGIHGRTVPPMMRVVFFEYIARLLFMKEIVDNQLHNRGIEKQDVKLIQVSAGKPGGGGGGQDTPILGHCGEVPW